MSLKVTSIDQLETLDSLNPLDYVIVKEISTGKDKKITVGQIKTGSIDGFLWDPDATYTDGQIREYNGKTWKWINPVDGNSTPSVSNPDWEDVELANEVVIPPWTNKVYRAEFSMVERSLGIYRLKASTSRPYQSNTWEPDKWDLLGGSGGGGGLSQADIDTYAKLAAIVVGLQAEFDSTEASSNTYTDAQLAGVVSDILAIQTLLQSDDTTLDELQEVVDYIKQNRNDLSSLGIANVSGLQAELDSRLKRTVDEGSYSIRPDADGARVFNIGELGSRFSRLDLNVSVAFIARLGNSDINMENDFVRLSNVINGLKTLRVDDTGIIVRDDAFSRGLQGYADYSANVQLLDYVQRAYVDTVLDSRFTALLAGVPTAGDNLNKLYNLTESNKRRRHVLAGSDLISDLTASTTTLVTYWRPHNDVTIFSQISSVLEAPTGAAITIDIRVDGTSIFSTKPTIPDGGIQSSPGTLTGPSIDVSAGGLVTFYVETVGSTNAGKGIQFDLEYEQQ
ncbi:MAG: hypothetical protein ACFB2Y_16985 [Fulvivirga sp.]